jgi:hypothetical protein
VVVVDPASVLGRDGLDHVPAGGRIGRGDERRQPPVGESADAAELRRGDPAEPDVEPLRLRADAQPLEVEPFAVVVDDVVVPARSDHGERLVEPARPFLAGDAERLVLGGVGDAEPEGGEQPAAGHHGERRQLLGEDDRVASRQDEHAHPELEASGAAGGVCHRHDGVGRLGADALGQPQAVEPPALDEVDDITEVRAVEGGAGAETDPDAYLHPPIMRGSVSGW